MSRSRTILITGAAGFVGGHLIARLRREMGPQDRMVAMGLSGRGPEGTIPVVADLLDAAALTRAVAEHRPTAVMHLAAVAEPAKARAAPREAWDINLFGTMNMAMAVMKEAPEALFVAASSSEAYGQAFNEIDGPVSENAPLIPVNTYGATKAAADMLVRQLVADGLRGVRFRPFNHTGPGQSPRFVVAGFAEQIARIERGLQQPIVETGNLDAERDILDVTDVVEAYAKCLLGTAEPAPGAVYNLASGRPIRIGDLLSRLIGMATVAIETRTDPSRFRPNDIPRTWGDAGRAAQDLGWRSTISIDDTLRMVLDEKRAAL